MVIPKIDKEVDKTKYSLTGEEVYVHFSAVGFFYFVGLVRGSGRITSLKTGISHHLMDIWCFHKRYALGMNIQKRNTLREGVEDGHE